MLDFGTIVFILRTPRFLADCGSACCDLQRSNVCREQWLDSIGHGVATCDVSQGLPKAQPFYDEISEGGCS
jgi:hypothetical protein